MKLASEVESVQSWRIFARRTLYGQRRMHLVSVENVADTIALLANRRVLLPERVNICDDMDEANSFEAVQDVLLRAFGRPAISDRPRLPGFALRAVLRAQRLDAHRPTRRFSDARLRLLGFKPEQAFVTRLEHYARWLARAERAA